MITTTEVPGYIIIVLIAFALGITVTIFCISLRNQSKDDKDNKDEK